MTDGHVGSHEDELAFSVWISSISHHTSIATRKFHLLSGVKSVFFTPQNNYCIFIQSLLLPAFSSASHPRFSFHVDTWHSGSSSGNHPPFALAGLPVGARWCARCRQRIRGPGCRAARTRLAARGAHRAAAAAGRHWRVAPVAPGTGACARHCPAPAAGWPDRPAAGAAPGQCPRLGAYGGGRVTAAAVAGRSCGRCLLGCRAGLAGR